MERVFCPAADEIREEGGDLMRERVGENERVVREVGREEIMGGSKVDERC